MHLYYSDEIIEQVREANDIVDVVGTYVHLKHSGSHYVGLCPFHSEKTGSFSVNKNMQIYKCFGCGKGGNVFTFMMEYDNLSFPEAVKALADRAGIALPEAEESPEEKERRSMRDRILEANKEAAKYYFKMLRTPEGKPAYDYLSGRALTDDTMKSFGLGYAGRNSNGLYNYLKSLGFSDSVLKETGLFTFSEKGASDKFWNRVMFPIMDRNCKVIAFGGRIMGKAENVPKYLNSPETKAFIKGDNLYGLHAARRTHKNYMLLCEGYMDVIALHQAGFTNAVASLGTALTPRQARIIGNYVHEVIITYDSDGPGQKAALRAIPILKEAGVTTRVLDMKPYKDPDEFIKALGSEAYEERISQARSSFFFETEAMRSSFDTTNPAEKTGFDHALVRRLADIEDELERSNYIEAASRQYNIDYAALTRAVNKCGLEAEQSRVAKISQERDREQHKRMAKPEDGPVRSQQLLVSMIANTPEFYTSVSTVLKPEDFTDPLCRQLAAMIFNLRSEGEKIVHAKLINNFEEVGDQEKVAGILDSSLYEENINEEERRAAFADLTVRVLTDSLEGQWQKAVAENDAASIQELMIRRSGLDRLRRQLMDKKQ